MSRRPATLLAIGLLAAGCAASCNAVFGVEGGEMTSGGATTTGGTSTSSGDTTTSETTSTTAGPCYQEIAAPSGKAYEMRPTDTPGAEWMSAGAFDSQGNVVVVGSFYGDTLNLGGVEHQHTPKSDFYDQNIFVAKYGPDNTYAWSVTFGGDASSVAYAAAVGPDDEIWVLGSFHGTLQVGETLLTHDDTLEGAKYEDMFVLKLDAAGDVLLARRFGSEYKEYGQAIAVDSKGNAFIAGSGYHIMDFGTLPFGVSNVWSSFVLKLDPDGDLAWVDSHAFWNEDMDFYPAPHREIAVAVDRDDHVIFGGHFDGQTYFGDDIVVPEGGTDAFVLKLDQEGELLWTQFIHGPPGNDGDQAVTALATDRCTGEIYVTGVYKTALQIEGQPAVTISDGAPADDDMFLLKLSPDGTPVWSKTYGDAGLQRPWGLAVDPAGNVVFTGTFRDADGSDGVDFGPEIGVLKPMSPSMPDDYRPDLFIAKLTPDGDGLWGYRLGDQWDQLGWSVATDAAGNIALTGEIDGTLKLPGYSVYTSKHYDGFVGWLSP